MSTLRIYMQQKPLFNNQSQSVIYVGLNPANLTQLINTPLPSSRQWPGYGGFYDATGDCSDPNKLELTWTQDKDTYGQSTPGEFKAKKSASGTLTFEGDTYQLIKSWLIDDVSAPLNAIEVKIHDVGCDIWYNDYAFDNTDLMFCANKLCTFDVTLRQKDEALSCIKRTIISDNWQGWFQTVPAGGKKHPRFSYCNEQRPNGMLVCLWFLMGSIMAPLLLIMLIVLVIFNIIATIINIIIGVIQFIISIVGGNDPGNVDWSVIPTPPPQGLIDTFAMQFVESGGCGREHPAPLIRDYITNVCDKCGVKVTPASAPIFFSQQLTIDTSTRGLVTIDNPHFDDCYLTPVSVPGIRRVDNLNIFLGIQYNNSDYYVPENAPLLSLDMFLDEIKPIYNAEWEIRDNTLYFNRKDFALSENCLFDFTGVDPYLELCFTWNEKDYPAAMKGIYQQDPADKPGNNAKAYYNDILSFANTDTNPLYEGILDKTCQIAPTGFRLNGASEDYIYDAMQVCLNSLFLNIAAIPLMFSASNFFKRYADYGVLMQHETATLPKILTWDGVAYENAKAVRPYFAHGAAGGMPPINSNYNTTPWNALHSPKTYVRGSSWTIPPSQAGYYLVTDTFGIGEIKQPAMLCNYFMYLAPGFQDSLWDLFHWIDDPKKNPQLHQEWSVKIDLCCENLERLGMVNGAMNPALKGKVKLPGQFYTDGRIKEITVHYETEGEFGQYIEIKGTV